MSFIPERHIEIAAERIRSGHRLEPNFDVEDLADRLGLAILWEHIDDDPSHPTFGMLAPEQRLIVLNEGRIAALEARSHRLLRYTVGHEIGHWELHAGPMRSGNLILFQDGRIWCRDGSSDPVERQAEMFSARLLMPRSQILKSIPEGPWSGWSLVYRLADTFGVNATPMIIRLEELELAHRDESGQPTSGARRPRGQRALF